MSTSLSGRSWVRGGEDNAGVYTAKREHSHTEGRGPLPHGSVLFILKYGMLFFKYPLFFLERELGSGCLKGGGKNGGRKLHINKPDYPTARSPQKGVRGLAESPGSASGASARPGAPQLSIFSLLEFEGPDVLRPACPAFGFLIVAAHCAFQDFVLNRKRGEKWKETFREDTWCSLP